MLSESIKTTSVHDLTPEEEVTLENDLLGLDVDDQSAEMDIVSDIDEDNDDDDVDEPEEGDMDDIGEVF